MAMRSSLNGLLSSDTLTPGPNVPTAWRDRKSTRLNSSHSQISYAVFCLKKKKKKSRNTSSADLLKNTMTAHHYKLPFGFMSATLADIDKGFPKPGSSHIESNHRLYIQDT